MRLHLFAGPLLLFVVLLLTGCSTTPLLNFTIVSTKSLPMEALETLERGERRVSGETSQQMYLIFPIGTLDVQTSINRAIESEPGCVALADGTISREDRIFFPFIYADSKIIVEGTPLIRRSE